MGCSNSLNRTHGRTALGSSNGGDHSGGGRRNNDGRARVRPAGRGRRGATHPGSKVVSSARLHHGWAKEGNERMGRGEDGMKMKGRGGLNRRVREGERLNPFNIHKWVVSGYGSKKLEKLMGCRKRKVAGRKRQEKMNSA